MHETWHLKGNLHGVQREWKIKPRTKLTLLPIGMEEKNPIFFAYATGRDGRFCWAVNRYQSTQVEVLENGSFSNKRAGMLGGEKPVVPLEVRFQNKSITNLLFVTPAQNS